MIAPKVGNPLCSKLHVELSLRGMRPNNTRSKLASAGMVRMILLMAMLVAGAPSFAAGERFVLVSHAADSDTWWDTVKNAIKQAGEDFNVTVDYRNPSKGDAHQMALLIDQVAGEHYDGMIATISGSEVLAALQRASAKNIPLITINSGTQQESRQTGAIMHVGQPEYEAGRAAGIRARAAGIKSFVCVNTFSQNPVSFERCRGFAEAVGIADYRAATLVAGTDSSSVGALLGAYLHRHPRTQAILTLGPDGCAATLRVLDELGLKGRIWFATFDLSQEAVKAVRDGSLQFVIDQQPYLQGYIPVAVLALMQREKTRNLEKVMQMLHDSPKFNARLEEYGLAPLYGAHLISSGPGFVTERNIDKVEKYAGKYR